MTINKYEQQSREAIDRPPSQAYRQRQPARTRVAGTKGALIGAALLSLVACASQPQLAQSARPTASQQGSTGVVTPAIEAAPVLPSETASTTAVHQPGSSDRVGAPSPAIPTQSQPAGPRLFVRGPAWSFAPSRRKASKRLLLRDSVGAFYGADGVTKIVMPVRGGLRLFFKGGSTTMSTGMATGWALSPKLQWAVVTDRDRKLHVFSIPGGKLLRKVQMPPCPQCKPELRDHHETSPVVFHTASKVVFHNNCQLHMLDLAKGQATPQPLGKQACIRAHTRGGSADGQVWWSGKATPKFGPSSDEKYLQLFSTQVASGNTRSLLKTSKKRAALYPRAAPDGKRICYQRINPRSKPLPRGTFLPELQRPGVHTAEQHALRASQRAD